MTGTPITYPNQQVVNGLIAAAILGFAIAVLAVASIPFSFIPLMVLALILGVAFVLPIGGADMPVVISLLNACTGLAVAASGFTLNNFALIVAGTLVGASGSLLTKLMSDAMGRSIGNILFGAFGKIQTAASGAGTAQARSVRSGSAEDLATLLAYSRRVIIVPGYGLAVAQAQHAARELADALEKRGVEVINKLARVQRQMLQDLGREPTPEELASELDMTAEKVIEVQKYGREPISVSYTHLTLPTKA